MSGRDRLITSINNRLMRRAAGNKSQGIFSRQTGTTPLVSSRSRMGTDPTTGDIFFTIDESIVDGDDVLG